ncbi:MAG: hypothetical protein AAGD13_06455 [Pseudomonadota bacterium]
MLLLNSITDAGPDAAGAVIVSGSHGGLYPAVVASRAGARAVIFNDAGGGAGVAGVDALTDVGTAAAAVDCFSALIGSADDMVAHGRLSHVNAEAARLGLSIGGSVKDAVELLRGANNSTRVLDPVKEARFETTLESGLTILLVDSASLVAPEDRGRVIITGSHGGLVGGDPARALKADARLAVFNDAGIGKNKVGVSRLPALDARGIAGLTVAHDSARIGDAQSAFETGVISAANRTARGLGAREGNRLAAFLAELPPG